MFRLLAGLTDSALRPSTLHVNSSSALGGIAKPIDGTVGRAEGVRGGGGIVGLQYVNEAGSRLSVWKRYGGVSPPILPTQSINPSPLSTPSVPPSPTLSPPLESTSLPTGATLAYALPSLSTKKGEEFLTTKKSTRYSYDG